MATATIKKASVNSTFVDGTRVSVPIYVGVSPSTAKAILSILRAKVATGPSPVATTNGISVQHATESQAERAMTHRLKVDLHTLRSLLFSSETRGVAFDLAMRIQKELGDELVFVNEDVIRTAFESSMEHYRNYYNGTSED
jgi:hypothetical protein